MFGYDLPRLHAALNDFPPALLLCAVLFDLAGWILRRESLIWAGIWTLWTGVIGGWAAVIAGELAEKKIDLPLAALRPDLKAILRRKRRRRE